MLPIPTPRAVAALLGCAGMWLIGVVTSSWLVTVVASGASIAFMTCLAATIPLGRRVRGQRLEFAWWLGHGDGATLSGTVVPGVPFAIRCYVRHRGAAPLVLTRVEAVVPAPARVLEDEGDGLVVHPRARTEFGFTLMAPAAGRVVLHGLAVNLRGPLGLFDVPLYFPNALAVKVLPRATAVRANAVGSLTGLPVDRAGRHRMRRSGGGTELHELRELQPGDPFKSIAWKASARQGKLLVREVDQEVQQTLMLVLDVGGSMRGGKAGERKLDFALELAAAQARAWLDRGDQVGVITVDGRVLDQVAPGEGAPQLIRIYDSLLHATEVVDADLTTLDDREVIELVARYVRHQDGLDFSAKTGERWDVPSLVAHIKSNSPDPEREPPDAQSSAGREMRRFCRARGIALPHRATPHGGDKAPGLVAALREAGGHVRVPRSIVVVSDLDAVHDYDAIRSGVRLLQKHRHHVSFLVPDAATLAQQNDEPLEQALHTLYGRAEERRLRQARQTLGPLGVPVMLSDPAAGRLLKALPGRTPAKRAPLPTVA